MCNNSINKKSEDFVIKRGMTDSSAKNGKGVEMDGLLFVIFWFGGATLHTIYDLKVKEWFKTVRERRA
jgi:hypothetical protein